MTARLAALVLPMATALAAFANQSEPPQARPRGEVPRIEAPVEIDGDLGEIVWKQAWSTELPVEVSPGENTPAPVRTEVMLFHDEGALYVAFRAFDPEPSAIRAHLTDRDDAWSDDWVGVVLDTFHDQRRDYLLLVNPLGVQIDNIETWPGEGATWDGIWESAAAVHSWGWAAEMRIPFSTLRFQRSEGPQIWGFDAVRFYPRTTSAQMGAFARDRSNNCYLCQAIEIEGFAGVSPGRNLEIVPTVVASRTDALAGAAAKVFAEGDIESELGITARWGFTPNLTLSGTVQPDYSQVEADALQLEVNQPFALFFPEKRPFFMEGADFFDTSLDVVYTRMLRDPAWGAKITGKEGAHTVGTYVVEDEVTNLIFPGSQFSDAASLDTGNLSSVARYKYDLDDRFTFGVLGTSREGSDGYFNRVAGVDGDLRLSPRDRLLVQAMESRTQYSDAVAGAYGQPEGDFSGAAYNLEYYHETRSWLLWSALRDVDEGFRADLGFMPQVDQRFGEVGAGLLWTGSPGDWYSRTELLWKVNHSEDHQGNLLLDEYVLKFNYEGPLQSHAFLRPRHAREGWAGEEYDYDEVYLHLCLHPNGHSQAWLEVIAGGRLDYAGSREGERLQVRPGFWYRFGPHLRLELDYTSEQMEVDAGWLYNASVGQLGVAWQFDARTFVRAILQNVDYEFNPEVDLAGREPEYQHLFSQLLFSYKLNPQTVLFVGYSDNSYGDVTTDLTRQDRTLFIKVGYAFVM
jgi:hypothetical protein